MILVALTVYMSKGFEGYPVGIGEFLFCDVAEEFGS
jgi:hypothetical protein